MRIPDGTIRAVLLIVVSVQIALSADNVQIVTGIVTDLGKHPVHGAVVSCDYSNQSVTTGPDGTFSIGVGSSTMLRRFGVSKAYPKKSAPKPTVSLHWGGKSEAAAVYDIFGRRFRDPSRSQDVAPQVIVKVAAKRSHSTWNSVAMQYSPTETTTDRVRTLNVSKDTSTTQRNVPVDGAENIEIILPIGRKHIAPLPETSPEEQQVLIDRLIPKFDETEIEYDSSRNVVHVKFLNHKESERSRLNDNDMKDLRTLCQLQSIWLEGQGVTDEGIAVLAEFPKLTEARFHYMNRLMPRVTPDFISPIAVHRDLRVLEIKHNFGSPLNNETSVHTLDGFPLLERLVLDNAAAGPEAVSLIRKCPRVKTLQLHRTSMSDSDFQNVVDALPLLDTLWLRPIRNNMTEIGLEALRGHTSLEVVGMNLDFQDFESETALAPFVSIPTLKKFRFVDIENLQPAYRWFHEQRPDVLICSWKSTCL